MHMKFSKRIEIPNQVDTILKHRHMKIFKNRKPSCENFLLQGVAVILKLTNLQMWQKKHNYENLPQLLQEHERGDRIKFIWETLVIFAWFKGQLDNLKKWTKKWRLKERISCRE